MKSKFLVISILVILVLGFSGLYPVYATSIQHPKVIVYGDVTKDVYPGRSIFEYKDDQGLSSVLPFQRQEKNITIPFSNIIFDKDFLNTSIANGLISGDTDKFMVTRDMLSSNYLNYIYLKIVNSTNLFPSTTYRVTVDMNITERVITTSDYILVTASPTKIGANLVAWRVIIGFKIIDTGGTTRWLIIFIAGEDGTDTVASVDNWVNTGYTGVCYYSYGNNNVYNTVQVKIGDLLAKAGVSWIPSKVIGIKFVLSLITGSVLDNSNGVEAKIRHTIISTNKIYIDDPSYENGLVINGTQGIFTSAAGDTIQIYGANVTKIVGLTIPWQVEVEPEIDTDPDNLKMQYTWEFTMPKSPTTGDTLTFSNTNITLYGYKDGSAWDKLYLNGVDKLSNIANLKPDQTTGYWTYGLATSLGEGNMYQVIARIQYTADEYDSLTAEPIFWSNPVAWLQYKFWQLLIAIASFLGIGTAWARRRKRSLRRVRR